MSIRSYTSRLSTIALATMLAIGLSGLSAAEAADISVKIDGLKKGGDLYVQLQTSDQFMGQQRVAGSIKQNVEDDDYVVRFENIAPGQYAISIWHDLDGDGVFDTDERGVPSEGVAFAGQGALMGPPQFDQVSFKLGTQDRQFETRILYPHH